MQDVFTHMHNQHICHGDLYAHNTLFNQQGQIIFGDFGASSPYQMLSIAQQHQIKRIEHIIRDQAYILASAGTFHVATKAYTSAKTQKEKVTLQKGDGLEVTRQHQ